MCQNALILTAEQNFTKTNVCVTEIKRKTKVKSKEERKQKKSSRKF